MAATTLTRPTLRNNVWLWLAGAIGVLALAYALSLALPALTEKFPADWYLGVKPRVDIFQQWVTNNRLSHPAFLYFFDPVSAAIDAGVRLIERVLLSIHWAILTGAFALAGWLLGGWRLALLCGAGFLAFGLLGLWTQSLQTLALMSASVILALVVGIPLGIACALSDRFDRITKPILDAMQTMPAFVYLIPVVLFFGIARVPAVIATFIYAVSPVIRLTNLGIREVPLSAVEAGQAFGSTRGQLLGKVLLPLALPALMAGVNQTIMMALGMVVIAAMVGAGGLGREVYLSLQRLQVGQAFEAGLAIVILAILLDRLSEALSKIDLTEQRRRTMDDRRREIGVAVIVMLTAVCVIAFQETFPADWLLPIRGPIDSGIVWVRDTFFRFTGPLSDFLTLSLLNPMRDLLRQVLPWPVVVAAVGLIAYRFGGWRMAVGSAIGMFAIGLLGMWANAMDTLSQVLITMGVTILIAIPIGVLASQYAGVRRVLRPILDFLQTVPTFVYLVPVIMLFNIGRVPGLIASVLYAIPVGIKLTELGIRQVSSEAVEAAHAFGSTRAQTIVKVQLPLARAAIALSINQMIMMVLAMVIISGMVGGAGLGFQAVEGLARSAVGQGIEAGLAIVILAIILDRITHAWATRQN